MSLITIPTNLGETVRTPLGHMPADAWCRREVRRMNAAAKRRGAKVRYKVTQTRSSVWIEEK